MGKNAPTLKELAAFLEAAEASGPRDHALACLLGLNGLSEEAVCAATVADLGRDAEGWTLRASLTGGSPVPVPLAPRTAIALDEYLDGRSEGPLLLSGDGSALAAAEAAQVVRRIVRAAGLSYRLPGG